MQNLFNLFEIECQGVRFHVIFPLPLLNNKLFAFEKHFEFKNLLKLKGLG